MATRLLIVRHGQSEWNAEGRWQGRADPSLSREGRAQAEVAAGRLRGAVDEVVSSPLKRAFETADIISSVLGLGPVPTDDDLQEIDVGEWTGLKTAEIEERFGDELRAWREGRLEATTGGENLVVFLQRVLGAFDRVARERDGQRVLVLTHGAVIGRAERHFGCHPGVPTGNLSGRWFEFDGELRPAGERVSLLPEPGEPAPEAQ